jgi:hypothetical protein
MFGITRRTGKYAAAVTSCSRLPVVDGAAAQLVFACLTGETNSAEAYHGAMGVKTRRDFFGWYRIAERRQ